MTTPSQVLLLTANAFEVDPGLVLSQLRTPDALAARHVTAFLLVTRLKLSSTQAAVELGGRDHTTILNALKRVKERRQSDHLFNSVINAIEAQIDLMDRLEGLSVINVLAVASNAANSRRAAMALNVHEIMALANTVQEVWQIAEAAGVLAHHIKTAAHPETIHELARNISDQLSMIAEVNPETEKEETDECTS